MSDTDNLPVLAVVVPDGVGVKDFVYTGFLSTLAGRYRLRVFHAVTDRHLDFLPITDGVSYHHLLHPTRTLLTYAIEQVLFYMHIYNNFTPGRQYQSTFKKQGRRRSVLFRDMCQYVGKFFASHKNLARLDRLYFKLAQRTPEVKEMKRIFEDMGIVGVFCTHQRPRSAMPPTVAARMLGLPAMTFISSWDNLSVKGRIFIPFSHYCVWNDHMLHEMNKFFPEVPTENIYVTGTTHFKDPKKIMSRSDFFDRIGADPDRPLIFYSTGVPTYFYKEYEYVRVVLEAIGKGEIPGNPQVVVRTTPSFEEERFNHLLADYPELIITHPAWTKNERESIPSIPYPDDPIFLDALNRYCDININCMSTMTLDAAIFDKPVINTFFDIVDDEDESMSLRVFGFAQMDHVQLLLSANATKFATSPGHLIESVNAYLLDKNLHRKEREAMVNFHTAGAIENADINILEAINSVMLTRKAS